MRIIVNYDGVSNSDQYIVNAFNFFGEKITELMIHTAIPYVSCYSSLEFGMGDPSYVEEIDQAYFTSKCLDKQKEIQVKYPKIVIEPVISRGTPAFGILTACRAHDPDLVILDQSDERFGIFGLSNDRWAQVRKNCQKPLLVVKRGASASRRP